MSWENQVSCEEAIKDTSREIVPSLSWADLLPAITSKLQQLQVFGSLWRGNWQWFQRHLLLCYLYDSLPVFNWLNPSKPLKLPQWCWQSAASHGEPAAYRHDRRRDLWNDKSFLKLPLHKMSRDIQEIWIKVQRINMAAFAAQPTACLLPKLDKNRRTQGWIFSLTLV